MAQYESSFYQSDDIFILLGFGLAAKGCCRRTLKFKLRPELSLFKPHERCAIKAQATFHSPNRVTPY